MMCVCVYIYIYTHTHLSLSLSQYIHICIDIYIHIHTYMYNMCIPRAWRGPRRSCRCRRAQSGRPGGTTGTRRWWRSWCCLYILLWISLYVYIYIYIYIYVHTYWYTYIYIYISLSLSLSLSIYLSIYLSICLSLSLYIYIYIYSPCRGSRARAPGPGRFFTGSATKGRFENGLTLCFKVWPPNCKTMQLQLPHTYPLLWTLDFWSGVPGHAVAGAGGVDPDAGVPWVALITCPTLLV